MEHVPDTADPYALLCASHPGLANVNKANMPQFMVHMTTWMRQREMERPDSIVDFDPLIEPLSREIGEAIFRVFPQLAAGREVANYVNLRAYFMDQALKQHDPAIKQLVIVGGALDTRAYRVAELADFTVFDLQTSADVMAHKEQVLAELGAEITAKKRTAILTSLTDDSWQADLLSAGFDPRKPVFWLMESTLQFLTPEQMLQLINGIDFMSAPRSQLVTERVIGGGLDLELGEDKQVALLVHTGLRYGEDGGIFREFPWNVQLLARRNRACEYYGTMWDDERFERLQVPPEEATLGPWFIPFFSKPA